LGRFVKSEDVGEDLVDETGGFELLLLPVFAGRLVGKACHHLEKQGETL
jgi:hypothetical protein